MFKYLFLLLLLSNCTPIFNHSLKDKIICNKNPTKKCEITIIGWDLKSGKYGIKLRCGNIYYDGGYWTDQDLRNYCNET